MKRILTCLSWICLSWSIVNSQVSYLDRPDLLEKAELCLQHTYGFSFTRAREIQAELASSTPDHPAPVFMEALIVYWENFPLDPSASASSHFINLMDRALDLSEELRQKDVTYTEGVFFDLFSRAFKAMFWADNGKNAKVIPDLANMYRYTKKGFDLKDEFVEFYFSTGLYNYYIEAYPEAHPAFKPFVAFMHQGDRDLGLEQLNHAITQCIFLKVEAVFFMSLIQLNYEQNLQTAANLAEKLVNDYPGNILYQGHLINILLHLNRFEQVRQLIAATAKQKDMYSSMIRAFSKAFLAEKDSGEELVARKAYQETIELAEEFGPFADTYQAMGYMGLSRLYEKKGLHQEAKTFARKASRLTHYAFILEEQTSGSR